MASPDVQATDDGAADGARADAQPPLPGIGDALGGPLGTVESALPTAVFVAAISLTDATVTSASVVAVAVAAVLAVVRLVRGETLRFVAGGLAGVAFAAFVAAKSGRAENFFLPGLLVNLAYAAGCLVSLVARRPLVGYVVTAFHGIDPTARWHADRTFAQAATRATWMWAAIFALKLAVQLPLYLAGEVVALGVAKIAMGYPLYALGLWLSWLLLRQVPVPRPTAERTDPD